MARNVVAALALCVLSGCGTLVNLAAAKEERASCGEPPQVYGGVCMSAAVGAGIIAEAPNDPKGGPVVGVLDCVFGACYLLIDLPLSAAGDTLTLPYTLYLAAQKDRPADPHEAAAK
jgi:uncharacterized protein YceK